MAIFSKLGQKLAKNGLNDPIFGKLVISNDLKRPMVPFLKILTFGRFFRILWAKSF